MELHLLQEQVIPTPQRCIAYASTLAFRKSGQYSFVSMARKALLISYWTGSGIGREVALTLASRGAHTVVCADINLEAAKQTAEKSQSCKAGNVTDYKVHALHVDVRDESSVGQMVDEAKSLFGRIDYFVNTAGVSSSVASVSHTPESAVRGLVCLYFASAVSNGLHIADYAFPSSLVPPARKQLLQCHSRTTGVWMKFTT